MKKRKGKWNGILNEGGFDNFSVNGDLYMQRQVLYKNNPNIEGKKRLNMAYLQLTNPQMIEVIQRNGAYFFHGTNANALPNILKYGLNSVNESLKNGIDLTTGEEWTRVNGERSFISLTDCFHEALEYANIRPKDNVANSVFNFPVIIGTTFENMEGLKVAGVHSDISEIGVNGNLPLDHIKFLAVSEDKVEFVRKLVGEQDIEVIGNDMQDIFFCQDFQGKLNMLEQKTEDRKPQYLTYSKDDIKPVVNERKTSGIKGLFEVLKAKWKSRDGKNISERG